MYPELTGDPGDLVQRHPIFVREVASVSLHGNQAIHAGAMEKPVLGDVSCSRCAGWLHTEDVACQDEEGYVYIVGRKKDMIISGGCNIYPRMAVGPHGARSHACSCHRGSGASGARGASHSPGQSPRGLGVLTDAGTAGRPLPNYLLYSHTRPQWMGHAKMETTAIYCNAVGEEQQSITARMWT